MKRVFGIIVGLVICAPGLSWACGGSGYATNAASVFETQEAVESSTFSWAIRASQGKFSATSALNEAPPSACTVCLYYRVGQTGNLKVMKCKRSAKRTTTFRAYKLRGVKITNANKNKQVVTMATETICGGSVVQSNAYSRYPDCGYSGAEYQNSSVWATKLKKAVG